MTDGYVPAFRPARIKVRAPSPFTVTPEIRQFWEAYAVAKMQAEDSLLLADGIRRRQGLLCLPGRVQRPRCGASSLRQAGERGEGAA